MDCRTEESEGRQHGVELAHPKTVHLTDFLRETRRVLQFTVHCSYCLSFNDNNRIICYESTILSGQHSRLPRCGSELHLSSPGWRPPLPTFCS